MTEIIAKMDEWTAEHFQGTSPFEMKLWGHCELARRSSQGTSTVGEAPIVITINGTSDRELVTIDDRYDFISWWRTPTPVNIQNTIDNSDWSFGFESGRVQKITFRWVLAWKVGHGEMIALNLASELPTNLVIDGYQYVSIDKVNIAIDHDDEGIYLTELGNTVYEKRRSTWNLAVINLVAEYILDPDCIHPAPIPAEDWPTLIEPANVDPVVTTDPDPDSTIVQSNASWTAPTSTVTFVLMMAEVQVSSTPPVGGYQIIKQVPGVDQSYNDLGLRDVYASFFGYFIIADAGKYVPYIMKFVDEYGREIIVKNDVAEIIPS